MTFTNQTEVDRVTDMASRFAEAMVAGLASCGQIPNDETCVAIKRAACGLADGVIAGSKDVVQQRTKSCQ